MLDSRGQDYNLIDKEIANYIIKKNIKRERASLSKYACKNTKAIRISKKELGIPDSMNIRPAFFRDTDKIIHSLSYSRYIDKTQVFFLFDNDHITHRALHVQLVSKIARVIGRSLGLNEDLIEAIALGHDIGHAPYGHDGEGYLNKICQEKNIGYFYHNAQSVRFLMELENGGEGLNLTLQVLDGILCHNGEIINAKYEPDYNKTKEQFLNEYERCWVEEDFYKKINPMTLEGCVVRISDVISYIGRDIEDAIRIKLIKRGDIPEKVLRVIGKNNDEIVNNLVLDIINNSYGKDYISFSKEMYNALDILKNFNYDYIYFNENKMVQNNKISHMFDYLFEKYLNDLEINNLSSYIFEWYNQMDNDYKMNKNEKIVLDFMAGMTDRFINDEFERSVMPSRFGRDISDS